MSKWIKIEQLSCERLKIFEMHLKFFQSLVSDFNDIDRIELIFKTIKKLSRNIPKTAILMGFDIDLLKFIVIFMCYDKSFIIHEPGHLLPIEAIVIRNNCIPSFVDIINKELVK